MHTTEFVHVWAGDIESGLAAELVERVKETARQLVESMHGFKNLTVYLDQTAQGVTRVLVLTEWDDAHQWGRAQWESHVQDHMVWLYSATKNVRTHVYREAFRYPAGSA